MSKNLCVKDSLKEAYQDLSLKFVNYHLINNSASP
jgi:hypothetical protein